MIDLRTPQSRRCRRVFVHDQAPDVTDLFAGLGGASTGLAEAGYRIRLAMNHDRIQVAAHQANHPDTVHLVEDINAYDKRSLPRTRILWGSPICTEISPAGGRRRNRGQLTLDGHTPGKFERTRATALDIIAATEVHRTT